MDFEAVFHVWIGLYLPRIVEVHPIVEPVPLGTILVEELVVQEPAVLDVLNAVTGSHDEVPLGFLMVLGEGPSFLLGLFLDILVDRADEVVPGHLQPFSILQNRLWWYVRQVLQEALGPVGMVDLLW